MSSVKKKKRLTFPGDFDNLKRTFFFFLLFTWVILKLTISFKISLTLKEELYFFLNIFNEFVRFSFSFDLV